MLKGEKTGAHGWIGSGVVDIGGAGDGGGNVIRSCGANADSADDMEDNADRGDWNCVSPSAADVDDESGTRLSEDSSFTGPLADGIETPPTKVSLAGVKLESSEADIDLVVCSLFGAAECLNDGIMDLLTVDTVCAGGASCRSYP